MYVCYRKRQRNRNGPVERQQTGMGYKGIQYKIGKMQVKSMFMLGYMGMLQHWRIALFSFLLRVIISFFYIQAKYYWIYKYDHFLSCNVQKYFMSKSVPAIASPKKKSDIETIVGYI